MQKTRQNSQWNWLFQPTKRIEKGWPNPMHLDLGVYIMLKHHSFFFLEWIAGGNRLPMAFHQSHPVETKSNTFYWKNNRFCRSSILRLHQGMINPLSNLELLAGIFFTNLKRWGTFPENLTTSIRECNWRPCCGRIFSESQTQQNKQTF